MKLSKTQRALLTAALSDAVGPPWGSHDAGLRSASWWRTARSLTRAGLLRRLTDRKGYSQGSWLVLTDAGRTLAVLLENTR